MTIKKKYFIVVKIILLLLNNLKIYLIRTYVNTNLQQFLNNVSESIKKVFCVINYFCEVNIINLL